MFLAHRINSLTSDTAKQLFTVKCKLQEHPNVSAGSAGADIKVSCNSHFRHDWRVPLERAPNGTNEITLTKRSVRLLPPDSDKGEDCFFAEGCKALGKAIPIFPERYMYFVESMFYEEPIGVHQWWSYVMTAIMPEEKKKQLYECYTTIHLENTN
jgi:hypothetical protein